MVENRRKNQVQLVKFIVLEDDTIAHEGDIVYNYYDMRLVKLETIPDRDWDDINDGNLSERGLLMKAKRDIWCKLSIVDQNSMSRGKDYMNGERLCSVEFAKRRGFRGV